MSRSALSSSPPGSEDRARGEAPLHLAQRELHVGAGPEVEAQLRRAAHGAGADAPQAEDAAQRLLERSGDGDRHLVRLERAAAREHHDARVGHLGVDPRGQREQRPESAQGEQRDRQVDGRLVLKDSAR